MNATHITKNRYTKTSETYILVHVCTINRGSVLEVTRMCSNVCTVNRRSVLEITRMCSNSAVCKGDFEEVRPQSRGRAAVEVNRAFGARART